MGSDFYEVWLYARRSTARVRLSHGGSRGVILPEIFSGESLRLEPLRNPRKKNKSSARILSFRSKKDERKMGERMGRAAQKNFDIDARKKTR